MSKVKVHLPYYIGGDRIWESSNVELLRKLLTIIWNLLAMSLICAPKPTINYMCFNRDD